MAIIGESFHFSNDSLHKIIMTYVYTFFWSNDEFHKLLCRWTSLRIILLSSIRLYLNIMRVFSLRAEEILLEDAQTAENFARTAPFLLSILLREKRRKRAAAGRTTKTLLKVDRLARSKG